MPDTQSRSQNECHKEEGLYQTGETCRPTQTNFGKPSEVQGLTSLTTPNVPAPGLFREELQ